MTSVDRFHGRVLDVDVIVLGDELAVDAPIGSLELVVRDAGPFDETGGWLRLGTVDGEILRYTSYDDDTDTIALQDATTQAWVTGDRVELWDLDAGAAAAEWVASVLLDDSADGDPDTATIAHDLIDALADGIRAVIGESAVLEREVDGSELELVDILGRVLVRDITTATASTPAAPTGLTLDTGTYVLGGRNQARILASWDPVTTNLDGDEISDLDHYVVQTKPGAPAAPGNWGGDYQVPAGAENVVMSPFTVDETHSVRVKAVSLLEFSSPWSEPASILASDDGTPPSVPSTPTTSSRLGTVKVFWDGRNSAGGLMEADFDYVEVHASTSASFVPTPGSTTTVIGRLYGAGYEIMSVGPTGYNTTWYFRLVAVDTSGNASAASARADNTVKPLVDVSNFPDDAMDVLYARTGHFINLTADNFSSNLITADFIDFGSLNGELITGLQIQTTATANRGVKIKNTGIEAYTSSGLRSFFVDASTGNVEVLGTLKSGSTIEGALIIGSTFEGYDGSGNLTARLNHNGLTVYSSGATTAYITPGGIVQGTNLNAWNNVTAGGMLYAPTLSITGSATVQGITTSEKLHLTDPNTGSGGVDVLWQTGSNQVVANTSSRRFKYDEELLPIDLAAAYALEPKRSHRHDSEDPSTWFVSFIAEDAVDLGLEPWVVRDEDGEVFSFSYTNWTVAQQAMLRDLHARVTNLEEQAA